MDKIHKLKGRSVRTCISIDIRRKNLEAVVELDDELIISKDGVKAIITKLDELHKKNDLLEKFTDLENFESFKRPAEMKIKDYMIEFGSRYNKLKRHKTELPKDLLGFKLLKSANVPEFKEESIKATITEIDYDSIKDKLKSTFSNERENSESDPYEIKIKSEPTYFSRNEEDDTDTEEPVQDSLYTSNYRRQNYKRSDKKTSKQKYASLKKNREINANWRDTPKESKGKNPERNRQVTKCNICHSINHWASQYPDRNDDDEDLTYLVHELILHTTYDKTIFHSLLAETWNAAILDSGATHCLRRKMV